MRDDRQWGAVIAGLEDNSWLANKQQAAAAFKHELSTLARAGTRLLPASVARRLLACFFLGRLAYTYDLAILLGCCCACMFPW